MTFLQLEGLWSNMSVALNSRPAFWVGFPGKNIEVLTLYLEPLYLRWLVQ